MSAVAANRIDRGRWLLGAVLALVLHAAAVAALAWHSDAAEGDDGSSSIEIDLTQFGPQLRNSPDDLMPGPKQDFQEDSAATPAPPQADKTPREDQPKADSDPDGELALQQPQQESVPPPPPPPAPATAPQKQRPSAAQMASWSRRIAQALARHKGYPAAARKRRETGDVEFTFTIDASGAVVDSRVIRSSGHAALDQEALDTVKRASPFPPPPPGVTGKDLQFTQVLGFNFADAPRKR